MKASADHLLTIPLALGEPARSRFLAKIAPPSGRYGCMLWTGGGSVWGYGIFKIGKRMNALAHRIVAEGKYGDISGSFVLHACDDGRCCNPAHLRIGTQQENEADKHRTIEERIALSA